MLWDECPGLQLYQIPVHFQSNEKETCLITLALHCALGNCIMHSGPLREFLPLSLAERFATHPVVPW